MLLLVVLALLVGIYLIVRFTDNGGRSESFKSELVTFTNDQVTKVEIVSPEDTTVLEKKGDEWKVAGKYMADPSTVSSMLNTLKGIKPSRLASRSQETWKDFQVDESGTRVIVKEGSEKVADIILGRFNVEGQSSFYSYVRLKDEPDVYVAKNFMKMSIGTGDAAYRNDDILRINKDSVASIAFNYPDSAFTLTKFEDQWTIGDSEANNESVKKYLSGLRYVNSRNFADNPGAQELFDVVYQLEDGSSLKLSVYSGGGLSSSANANEYWVDPAVNEKVLKGPGYFMAE